MNKSTQRAAAAVTLNVRELVRSHFAYVAPSGGGSSPLFMRALVSPSGVLTGEKPYEVIVNGTRKCPSARMAIIEPLKYLSSLIITDDTWDVFDEEKRSAIRSFEPFSSENFGNQNDLGVAGVSFVLSQAYERKHGKDILSMLDTSHFYNNDSGNEINSSAKLLFGSFKSGDAEFKIGAGSPETFVRIIVGKRSSLSLKGSNLFVDLVVFSNACDTDGSGLLKLRYERHTELTNVPHNVSREILRAIGDGDYYHGFKCLTSYLTKRIGDEHTSAHKGLGEEHESYVGTGTNPGSVHDGLEDKPKGDELTTEDLIRKIKSEVAGKIKEELEGKPSKVNEKVINVNVSVDVKTSIDVKITVNK